MQQPTPDQTFIGRLQLTDFRNYAALSLELEPGIVVLAGENGAGKTNLLEAISLLSPGRGLRRAPYETVAREGAADGFAIHARLHGPFGDCQIGTGTMANGQPSGEGGRKVRVNGVSAKSAEALLEWLRVVWLVPSMDQLFTGAAGDRRRFLDRLVLAIDPAHGRRALDYEKAMRGRNRLLADPRSDPAWLDAIEAQMAETGVAMAAARHELVRLLSAMIERLPADGPFPRGGIILSGTIEQGLSERPAVDVEGDWLVALREGRARDRAAGRTLEGVHRCDLEVTHLPKRMPAGLSSTGEQKALLAGIVISHARLVAETTGMSPIMLMDEIAAHLDAERRAALFDILLEMDIQAFLTGTDASLFSALEGKAQFLAVATGGRITSSS
jgi:DNA replication and repair protein RecF